MFFNLKERELLENLAKEYDYIIQKNEELCRDCKILVEDIITSDRMIATGSVAGGIAREFNNILIGPKKLVMKMLDRDFPEEIKRARSLLLGGYSEKTREKIKSNIKFEVTEFKHNRNYRNITKWKKSRYMGNFTRRLEKR